DSQNRHKIINLIWLLASIVTFWSPSARGQTTINCAPRPPGLVAWWPADGLPLDLRGTNDAIPESGLTYAAGHVGQSFSFDGTARAAILESPRIDLSRTLNWTIEAWVHPTSLANHWPTIYSEGYWGVSFGLNSGTGLPESWINNTHAINGTVPVPLNQWSHVALTYDGTNRTFYVNGAFAGSGSAPASDANDSGSAIGDVVPSDGRSRFVGLIDELSLY